MLCVGVSVSAVGSPCRVPVTPRAGILRGLCCAGSCCSDVPRVAPGEDGDGDKLPGTAVPPRIRLPAAGDGAGRGTEVPWEPLPPPAAFCPMGRVDAPRDPTDLQGWGLRDCEAAGSSSS